MPQSSIISTNPVICEVSQDVWWHIFRTVYRELSEDTRGTLRLSQVCRMWRSIINATSDLWTNVKVEVSLYPPAPHAVPSVELLMLFLRQSRNRPLTLSLCTSEPWNRNYIPLNSDQVRLVLQTTNRAKRLALNFTVLDALFYFERLTFGYIRTEIHAGRLLEELTVEIAGASDLVVRHISRLWAGNHSPLLRSLRFEKSGVSNENILLFREDNFPLPFHQLTTLNVDTAIDVSDAFLLLSWSPSLVTASFQVIHGDLGESELQHVELQMLRTLKVFTMWSMGRGTRPLMQMFNFLILPSLSTLHLAFQKRDWSPESLLNFIQMSDTPRIEYLKLDINGARESDIIGCLNALPSLRTLELRAGATNGESDSYGQCLVRAMEEWDASSQTFAICPMLEKLLVDYGLICQTTTAAICVSMIEERLRRSSSGRGFELVLGVENAANGSLDLQEMLSIVHRLLQLKKAGLRLTLEDAPSGMDGIFVADV
ncbi:hypothetical protein CVT26_006641 [Gymnopilus dilepis]|uniref:Uncharacterized protein n=1 Tax=Gymnopilus dilepis TaxID=231916 RepID=A0A409Y2V6_9AGAR|nr:hypothetical protein CVT26_006641 [Gymnopilus dilepis]